jgi:hypothetical protein
MSTSAILSRTVEGEVDKRLALANGECKRIMSIGSSWNEIVLGVRYTFNSAGVNIAATPNLGFGIMSGTTNGFGAASADNVVGIYSNSATWTFSTGDTGSYFTGVNLAGFHKVGSTIASASAHSGYELSADTNISSVILFHAERSGSDVLIRKNGSSTAAMVQTHITKAAFESGMTAGSFLGISGEFGFNTSPPTAGTITAGEIVHGYLDSVFVYWDRISTTLEICDIAVARIS